MFNPFLGGEIKLEISAIITNESSVLKRKIDGTLLSLKRDRQERSNKLLFFVFKIKNTIVTNCRKAFNRLLFCLHKTILTVAYRGEVTWTLFCFCHNLLINFEKFLRWCILWPRVDFKFPLNKSCGELHLIVRLQFDFFYPSWMTWSEGAGSFLLDNANFCVVQQRIHRFAHKWNQRSFSFHLMSFRWWLNFEQKKL